MMIEAIIILHPTNTSGIIIIVLITKNNQEILLDLADLALQEHPEVMCHLSLVHRITLAHIPWLLSQSNPWNCIIQ